MFTFVCHVHYSDNVLYMNMNCMLMHTCHGFESHLRQLIFQSSSGVAELCCMFDWTVSQTGAYEIKIQYNRLNTPALHVCINRHNIILYMHECVSLFKVIWKWAEMHSTVMCVPVHLGTWARQC